MPRLKASHFHIAFAVAWMSVAMVLGIKTALLGNEQAGLAKQRGADLRARYELAAKNQRNRNDIDRAASAPVLSEAVRKLDLQIRPPLAVARSER